MNGNKSGRPLYTEEGRGKTYRFVDEEFLLLVDKHTAHQKNRRKNYDFDDE